MLFEIAHGRDLTAAALAKALRLDPAYLSRVLARLAALGLIDKRPSASDGRASTLRLTRAGRAAFDRPRPRRRRGGRGDARAAEPARRAKVAAAMATIMAELSAESAAEPPVVIRGHAPGDVGWVVHRHGALYAAEYGWDETFEGLVAEIAGRFLKAHDPTRERCWVAEREGEILGSVFVVDAGDGVAKLRLLYVEPNARGGGLGRRLVDEALRFAARAGYRKMTLWTNDILVAARRIYEATGFRLVASEPHRSFGKALVGETWEKDL